jgi:hypothetical protein
MVVKCEASLVAGKECCVAIDWEFACVPEPDWTLWREKRKILLQGITTKFLDCPTRNLVTILTELCWRETGYFSFNCGNSRAIAGFALPLIGSYLLPYFVQASGVWFLFLHIRPVLNALGSEYPVSGHDYAVVMLLAPCTLLRMRTRALVFL